jgi:6-phosphogluconolactonase
LDVELQIVQGPEEAARAAAELLVEAARSGGRIALAGGSTPKRAYGLAAQLEPDWTRAGLWWGDERCVPPEDERSNYRLAHDALLARLERQPRAVERILGELAPEAAAADYDRRLRGVVLDLVLLGIGPDGHTASLFPHHEALEETERLALPVNALGIDRVTTTPPPLRAAQHVVFLAVGDEKADAVRRAFAEAPDPATPASLIRSESGATTAILDRAAAGLIS